MPWSTSELADIAGSSVKAIRHYHGIGLLAEPERAANGYKQYRVEHLVRLLRIKRLTGLGLPLSRVSEVLGDEPSGSPDHALRVIDEELAATIERLRRVRAELAVILHAGGGTDLPEGFGDAGGRLSEADRALVLVYSRIFEPDAMDALRTMLRERDHLPEEDEFDSLPEDAPESQRQRLADRYAPHIRELVGRYEWLADPDAHVLPGRSRRIVGQALAELYNSAQLDVLARVEALNAVEADSTRSRS